MLSIAWKFSESGKIVGGPKNARGVFSETDKMLVLISLIKFNNF